MQLRQLHWYTQAFLKKHGKVIGSTAVIAIVGFLLLPNVLAGIGSLKKTTYVGRVGRFSLSGLPRDIQEKVSFGLTTSFDDGEVAPALASSYRFEEDGKAVRFTLRPNVRWQDGKIANPYDINYSISDTETARSQNDIVFRITSQKRDENAADPVLPVSFLSLVSQPLFKQIESRTIFFQKTSKIIGLGDYAITSVKNQGPMIKELIIESEKEKIIYRFYPTEHDAIVAFKRGEVDKLEELLVTEDLASWNNVQISNVEQADQYLGIFFNLNFKDGDNFPYTNRSIRQALNFAIEKSSQDARIFSPINKKSWAYITDESDIDRFDKDMEQASELLLNTETPTHLKIDLITTPTYVAKAESIAIAWQELGRLTLEKCKTLQAIPQDQCANKALEVNVRITNFPDISSYGVMIVGQQIPKDPDQYNMWHSTQQTNITRYKNPRVDKLLEDARQTTNREDRKLMYQEFQRIIVKDSPVIFLEEIQTKTVERRPLL